MLICFSVGKRGGNGGVGMRGRKAVSQSTAVGIVVVLALLLTISSTEIINYSSELRSKNSQISSVQSQLAALNSEKTDLQIELVNLRSQASSLNYQKAGLQSRLSDLNSTIRYLEALEAWLSGNISQFEARLSLLNSTYLAYKSSHSYTNSQYNSLQDQTDKLQTWLDGNASLVSNLKAPDLVTIDMKYTDNRPTRQQYYVRVYGSVCNVGSNPAYNSKLHVIAYSKSTKVIETDIKLKTGTIAGESGVSVDSTINYSGNAITSLTVIPEWTATP